MNIIIDLTNKCLSDNDLRKFTYDFWEDMAISQPAHKFVFISRLSGMECAAENVLIRRFRKTGLRWIDRWRYGKILGSVKADRMVTVDQQGFLIADGSGRSMKKNKVTRSQRRVLLAGYDLSSMPAHIPAAILYPAMRQAVPSLSWTAAESIKTQFTGGRSFFLFTGDINGQPPLIALLKAFSTFKKWQLSNMQLVIAGSNTAGSPELEEKLTSYKYRQDVVLLKDPDDATIAGLVAAAYAMVYPLPASSYPLALVWSIQGKKAMIASSSDTGRRLSNAAIWVHENNIAEGFAQAMIGIYKDESRQQQLVQQAFEQAPQFDRPSMLATAWRYIQQPLDE